MNTTHAVITRNTTNADNSALRTSSKPSLDQAARELRRDELPAYLDCVANKLIAQVRAQRANWAQRFPAFPG
ncbi:MAG: hypothetical protein LW838_11540 [Nitrosomonadaceae bacterium]|jgi:hypothetical protein|nr:hypothetical protein [Nitrosomonadaceae bacterium]